MRILPLCAIALLLGCASANVRELGNGRYALDATWHSGGYAGSREEAVQQANEYCGRSRETAVIDSLEDVPGLGPEGEHTSHIVFSCARPPTLHF